MIFYKKQDRKPVRWALTLLSCVLAARCGTRVDPSEGDIAEPVVGSLRVPLVTPEEEQFRLREALFEVRRTGPDPVLTLDSESDAAATSLDAELDQGSYSMTLRDGWRLERPGDAGAAVPVSAALLTANPLSFEIQNARVTELIYRFTTDQGIVTLGRGRASVSVSVAGTAPSRSCSLVDRSSCPAGQTCLLASDTGRTFCAEPGSLPVGSPCRSEQCVAGAQCLSLDPAKPDERLCTRFCRPDVSGCGCRSLAFDAAVGVCTEPQRDLVVDFSSRNCALIEHNFVSGDDRGGIAVSDDFVYYVGDSQTARFNIENLASPLAVASRRDGIVSDLDSGILHSLAIDGVPLDSGAISCGSGSVFTHLVQLDPAAAPSGRPLNLSLAVPYDCGSGIFAGPGFMLLATTSNVFHIEFGSGSVTDLGPRPFLAFQGCESWAFWGIAEQLGGEYRMVYVGGAAQIVRTSPNGVTEVAAAFANLSDMCSITVSRRLERWYFHHEGQSQFGGSDESIGYCDATFR